MSQEKVYEVVWRTQCELEALEKSLKRNDRAGIYTHIGRALADIGCARELLLAHEVSALGSKRE